MQTEPWDLGFLPASHRVSDWKVHHCGCADPAGLDGDADSDTRVPSRWCSRCCSTPQSPTGKRRMAPVVLLWRPWQLCTGSQSITVLNSVLIFIPGPSSLDAQGVDAAPPGGWVWLIVPASIFPFSEHPPPFAWGPNCLPENRLRSESQTISCDTECLTPRSWTGFKCPSSGLLRFPGKSSLTNKHLGGRVWPNSTYQMLHSLGSWPAEIQIQVHSALYFLCTKATWQLETAPTSVNCKSATTAHAKTAVCPFRLSPSFILVSGKSIGYFFKKPIA